MKILLNGEPFECANGIFISELLKQKRINSKAVVVEINMEIIKKESYKNRVINSGDKIEILHFVGGG